MNYSMQHCVAQSAVQAGKAAEIAAERKSAKYSGLSSSDIVIPVAVESLGPLADDAHRFITEIGRRMSFSTGIREKRHSCTNASHWRFNATMHCVLQTLPLTIRRSHSGHYHLHRHHRRRRHNNNNNNNKHICIAP